MIHPLTIPPFEFTSGVLLPDRRQDFKGFSSTSMFFRSPVTRFPSSPCDLRKLQKRGAFLLTKSHVEWLQHWHVIIEQLSINMQEHILNIQYTYLLAVSVKSVKLQVPWQLESYLHAHQLPQMTWILFTSCNSIFQATHTIKVSNDWYTPFPHWRSMPRRTLHLKPLPIIVKLNALRIVFSFKGQIQELSNCDYVDRP